MPTIRTTMRPGDEIVVSQSEYEQLLDLGLIYDGTPPVEPADPFDTRVAARLADSDSATRTAFDSIYTDVVDADISPIVANPASATSVALRAAFGRAAPVLSDFVYDPPTGNLLSYKEDGIPIVLTYNSDGTVATSKRGTEPTQTFSYSGGNLTGVA